MIRFLNPIIFLALFQVVEMLIRVTNFFESEQSSYRIFNIILPEFLMISSICFSLGLLFVNHTRYECFAEGTTCNGQQSLSPAAGGLRGTFSPPAVPGQRSDDGSPRGKTLGISRDLTVHICQKCQNTPSWSIYPKLQCHEFC